MTPDTVADGAETRVGEVNERQGDLWERAGRGGEEDGGGSRSNAFRCGKG